MFKGERQSQQQERRHEPAVTYVDSGRSVRVVKGAGAVHQQSASSSSNAAANRAPIVTGCTVMVTHLDPDVRADDIHEIFKRCGEIKSINVHFNAEGKSKGTADIVYRRRVDAEEAIKEFDGRVVDGETIRVRILGDNVTSAPPPVADPFMTSSVTSPSAAPAGSSGGLFAGSGAQQKGRGFAGGDSSAAASAPAGGRRGGSGNESSTSFRVTVSGGPPPPPSRRFGQHDDRDAASDNDDEESDEDMGGSGGGRRPGGGHRSSGGGDRRRRGNDSASNNNRRGGRDSGRDRQRNPRSGGGGLKEGSSPSAALPANATDLDAQLESYLKGGK